MRLCLLSFLCFSYTLSSYQSYVLPFLTWCQSYIWYFLIIPTFPLTRRCLRRQSARFKSHEREPTENLFEIEDAKLLVSQSRENSIQEEPVPLNSSFKNEDEGENCVPRNEAQASLRSSIGRPLRKAAEKVQSYKEAPLKSKMRREEWLESVPYESPSICSLLSVRV